MATMGGPQTSTGTYSIAHYDIFDIIISDYCSFVVHRIYLYWILFRLLTLGHMFKHQGTAPLWNWLYLEGAPFTNMVWL